MDGRFDPTLSECSCWMPSEIGSRTWVRWVGLGAALNLSSLELVIDDTYGGKGIVAWGWDESAIVVLGSGMAGWWEWR